MQSSRRSFLKTIAASAVAPLFLPSRVWSAPTGPNGKLGMGFIGMGTQSRGLLGNFLGQDTRVLAGCDVDTNRRNDAKSKVDQHYGNTDCQAYSDFREIINRKDIAAVCIATPDHWHALVTLAALRAGKDVYCEKPLTHNIHEAIEVMQAVDANQRVLQTGSMQRSMKEFRVACELVQNGVIGKITHVECQFGPPGKPCDLPTDPLEPGLDWDRWCGPGPLRGYSAVLSPRGIHSGFPRWRNYKEYGGGMVCDWGAHHLDIAQWGLGMDASGPVEVQPAAAGADSGAKLVYANGIFVEHKSAGFGVHFFGTNGEVKVNRGRFDLVVAGKSLTLPEKAGEADGKKNKASGKKNKASCAALVQAAEREYLQNPKVRLYVSTTHVSNFMECVKTRKKPITSEQIGGRSAICCHLLNQSYYHNAKLQWDPAKFAFAGGTGDPSWRTRDYRAPWKV
ncbi:MAG: Gfo/Idh/MocA family oxidoreductase [Kiritimatiellaeota bacterium]|nr:Gfo/Idh/MocA family oxidoreductase [Kiritimatiellota bacterium]